MRKIVFSLILLLSCINFSFSQTNQSILSDGAIYKIKVEKRGVYKLTYQQLSEAGLDLSNINTLQLFGNGGGMLPELVDAERVDDLAEIPFELVGGDDGSFDANDFILFYAESADQVFYDENSASFKVQRNAFDTYNYYFLKVGESESKAIEVTPNLNITEYTTSSFDDYLHFEEDRVNLLDAFISAQGSGKRWYGDQFKNIDTYNYDFTFPNLVTSEPVTINAVLAGRSRTSKRFTVEVAGTQLQSDLVRETNSSFSRPAETTYANRASLEGAFEATSDDIELSITYTGDEGWLDFITLNARRDLKVNTLPFFFRDTRTTNHASSTFQLEEVANDLIIWDVTNPLHPKVQSFDLNGTRASFGANTTELKEYIAFTTDRAYEPVAIETIENQNLHGIESVELVIVYPNEFEEQAQRLADHREDYSGLRVELVEINEIFNEFSSGKQDPTAIRDFAHLIYNRDTTFKYLLLFGDGSFDYRNIGERSGNFITVYETDHSENPITAFPSDDYFALLEAGEGANLRGDLDIAVGRLPVKTQQEARQVVDKIIRYDLSPTALGSWRNELVFLADDEDNNLHINDTDRIARIVEDNNTLFNQEKIYFDAYPQVSTAGGEGFPLATEAINQSVFQGALAVNYLGHGGSQGWAQERVIDKNRGDIRGWANNDRLPVFITATCSFAGYDDPNQVTGGEEVLLNPSGGGIALFTTVRAVFASSNATLVRSVFDTMLNKVNGQRPTLGEIMRTSKNSSSVGRTANSRKFTLLGDPSQQLALPLFDVVTTTVNGQSVTTNIDTLKALQEVVIEGEIRNTEGELVTNFNGELIPTIFDKEVMYTTLAQDSGSPPKNFTAQNNTIFKGKTSVSNGRFQFSFVVPKDINFNYGNGKISYYAKDESQMVDASGYFDEIIIGGADESIVPDREGPEIEVYLDNENFQFGDEVSANPTLLVKLSDESGINVVGNSIGHDLEAILDDNTQQAYLLNEYYESELNDYTSGTVLFPLNNLSAGRHTIKVKAWDVANNSSEAFTEFVVLAADQTNISDMLAFPNPFSEGTCFAFQHDLSNQTLTAQIEVYSIDGRLVKTIRESIFSADGIVDKNNCIQWNGQTDANRLLEKGLYIYKVILTTSDGTSVESAYEKLVVVR